MAGIYFHIPFCRKACTYCDFHFITSLKRAEEMVEALVREIGMRKDYFGAGEQLETIYLGGGTPSVLSEAQLARLFSVIHNHFEVSQDAEVTLEANPEDLSPSNLKAWLSLGINRLSVGVQSFRPEDLAWMNRAHTPEQAVRGLETAREAGFFNYSLDLIFGLPDLSLSAWEANLRQALALSPTHISLYALTVERSTALHNWVEKGKIALPEEEGYEAQFLLAHELLTDVGYEHYELSNYALPGFRSRHNGNYWRGVPYLGIGPSAHSFDGQRRSWNVANNSKYLKSLGEGQLATEESELLSRNDRYHEYIMTGLRKVEGLDLVYLQEAFEMDLDTRFGAFLSGLERQGQLWREGGHIGLTAAGWLLSDYVIRELFGEG